MNPESEEDLETFKKRINKQELKRARYTANWVAVSSIVALISIVYGVFQYKAVEAREVRLEQCANELVEYKIQMEKTEQRMLMQNQVVEKALKEAEMAQKYAEEQYKNAIKKRK